MFENARYYQNKIIQIPLRIHFIVQMLSQNNIDVLA